MTMRRRTQNGVAKVVLVVLFAALVAFCAVRGTGRALAPGVKELDLSPNGGTAEQEPQGCRAALAAGLKAFESSRKAWQAATESERIISRFGNVAEKALERSLKAFDRAAEAEGMQDACGAERASLQSTIVKVAEAALTSMRLLAERAAIDDLHDSLVTKMLQQGGPLRMQEKMDLLQTAVQGYHTSLQSLRPRWAKAMSDEEKTEVERRLGALELQIETSQEGETLRSMWDYKKTRDLLSERASGVSVSLDPGVRVMIRPDGLGNLQVYGSGPVGPPNAPASMNVGILNDGSIAEVYREHPVPPKFAVQPAVNVNLNLR